jgi:hypothetical protein
VSDRRCEDLQSLTLPARLVHAAGSPIGDNERGVTQCAGNDLS